MATSSRSGLVTFAGVMLLIAASLNLIDGVVALANDDYYAVDELLFGDLSAWGVWWLILGFLLLLAGVAILRRSAWGVIFAILLAGANFLSQFLFLGTYPAWAIAAMIVDGLIIYALTTRMGEFS